MLGQGSGPAGVGRGLGPKDRLNKYWLNLLQLTPMLRLGPGCDRVRAQPVIGIRLHPELEPSQLSGISAGSLVRVST